MASTRVKSFKSRLLEIAGTSLALVAGGAAQAQTAAPSAAPADDIVVTAERRDSTVQKTGISLTALKGSDLQTAGITTVQSVIAQVPGVSFKSGGPGQTEIEMRGLNSAGGNSPTVGFYLDDTPLTTFAFATAGKVVIDPSLYDLNRIEVLRGPQGTLYGAGSMGGTVRLLSNQPELNELRYSGELIGSATQGGGPGGTVNAMVNIPLAHDLAALRIVGSEKYADGWIDRKILSPFPTPTDPSGISFATVRGDVQNAAVARTVNNANDEHLQSVRATLLITPSSRLSITPMLMYQKLHAGGQSLIDQTQTATDLTAASDAKYRTLDAQYQPLDTPEPIDDEFKLASLGVKYHFDFADLSSTTALWKRTLTQVQDGSEVVQDVLGFPSFYTADGGLGSGPWVESDTAKQFSQELRLASAGNSPFQWLVGGFYSRLRSIQHQYATYSDPAAVANFAEVDPLAIDANGAATTFDQRVDQTIRQAAAFGEISYELSSAVKFAAGLRYFDFRSHAQTAEFGLFAPDGTLTPSNHTVDEHDHGFNPRFNVTWRKSNDLTLYATAAKGFRPGGTNLVIPTNGVAVGGTPEGDACAASLSSLGLANNPLSYKPDSVWSYEGGEKARLLGGHVTINSAAYFQKWSNIQRSITLGCAFIYSDNAGSANIYGGETEISGRIAGGLRLSVNASYTHATYDQVYTLPLSDGTGSVSRTGVEVGQSLPDVPRFTSAQALLYTAPLSDRLSWTAQVRNSYISSREETSSAFTNGAGNSNIPVLLPAYDVVAARIGVTSKAGRAITLFVDNLGNDQTPISAINSQVLNITPVRRVTVDRPRSFGVDLTFTH